MIDRKTASFYTHDVEAGLRIVNLGSINIDTTLSVEHIAKPGETIASTKLRRRIGGKGANQSVAVARSGAIDVFHAGRIGAGDEWITRSMHESGVNVTYIAKGDEPTGQAMIQVAVDGENAIVIHGGANKTFTHTWIESVLSQFSKGDWVMLQNETNLIEAIIHQGKTRGLHICFNPAPFDPTVHRLPLSLVDLLVLNELEASNLSGEPDPVKALELLCGLYTKTEIIITLGREGAIYGKGAKTRLMQASWDVPVVDTTAAGDTFIGWYLGHIVSGSSVQSALEAASAAASVTVMRAGAMDSIPTGEDLGVLAKYCLRTR